MKHETMFRNKTAKKKRKKKEKGAWWVACLRVGQPFAAPVSEQAGRPPAGGQGLVRARGLSVYGQVWLVVVWLSAAMAIRAAFVDMQPAEDGEDGV